MKKILFITTLLLLVFVEISLSLPGVKKRKPLPFEYGRIVINNSSEKAHIAPVVFDHWIHRGKYTCRVCHIDLGFTMEAGSTGITASDNMDGYYCGTCHNGKDAFTSCKIDTMLANNPECERCHSLGIKIKKKYGFRPYTKDFPRGRFGNGVDWEQAESTGKIQLQDIIAGVSMEDTFQYMNKDFEVGAKVEGFPDIIFSHEKHSVWNGCGGCHPGIFGVKKGTTQFTMQDIYQGKYCGVCHGKVAFPVTDCQRCHTKDVR